MTAHEMDQAIREEIADGIVRPRAEAFPVNGTVPEPLDGTA